MTRIFEESNSLRIWGSYCEGKEWRSKCPETGRVLEKLQVKENSRVLTADRLGNQEIFQRDTQQDLIRAIKEGKSNLLLWFWDLMPFPLESAAGLNDTL